MKIWGGRGQNKRMEAVTHPVYEGGDTQVPAHGAIAARLLEITSLGQTVLGMSGIRMLIKGTNQIKSRLVSSTHAKRLARFG